MTWWMGCALRPDCDVQIYSGTVGMEWELPEWVSLLRSCLRSSIGHLY